MADYFNLAQEILSAELMGESVEEFARPWFQDESIPILAYSSQVVAGTSPRLVIHAEQLTEVPWTFQIDLRIEPNSEDSLELARTETLKLTERFHRFSFPLTDARVKATLDPEWKVLCKKIDMKGRSPLNRGRFVD